MAARLRRRRRQERLEALSGHYLVWGYGRVGQEVVGDLRRRVAADLTVAPGDIPIALGTGEQLAALGRAAGLTS